MNDHIEIWAPEKWEKWRKENLGRYPEVQPAPELATGPPGGAPGPMGVCRRREARIAGEWW